MTTIANLGAGPSNVATLAGRLVHNRTTQLLEQLAEGRG